MKNQAKKMKESITFINAVDEEPLIFEEESKTQNLLREFDQSRTLDTGKFQVTNEDSKDEKGLVRPGSLERKQEKPAIKPQNVDQNRASGQQKTQPNEKTDADISETSVYTSPMVQQKEVLEEYKRENETEIPAHSSKILFQCLHPLQDAV